MIGKLGVRIGALDLFMPALLKPEAMRWRAALLAARAGAAMPDVPGVGRDGAGRARRRSGSAIARAGPQAIRVDIAERIARRAHEAKAGKVSRGDRRDARHLARPAARDGRRADARARLPARAGRGEMGLARPPPAGGRGATRRPPRPSRRCASWPVADSLRLDKFLWFARIVKTRALAQALAEERPCPPQRPARRPGERRRPGRRRADLRPARRGPGAEGRGAADAAAARRPRRARSISEPTG